MIFLYKYAFKVICIEKFQTIFQLEIHKSFLFIANTRYLNRRFPTNSSTFNKQKKFTGKLRYF